MKDVLLEVFPIGLGLGLLLGFISNVIGLLIKRISIFILKAYKKGGKYEINVNGRWCC